MRWNLAVLMVTLGLLCLFIGAEWSRPVIMASNMAQNLAPRLNVPEDTLRQELGREFRREATSSMLFVGVTVGGIVALQVKYLVVEWRKRSGPSA
jgi:hypothetical protein